MEVVTFEGPALDALLELLGAAHMRGLYRLRVAADGAAVKVKVNEGMWTADLNRPAVAVTA